MKLLSLNCNCQNSKKYPKKPANVGQAFSKSFNLYISAAKEFSEAVKTNSSIEWIGFDGTKFETDKGFKVDIAITSPPYINALDYIRAIKLESAWIDCGDDQTFTLLRKGHVGELSRSKLKSENVIQDLVEPYIKKISEIDLPRSKVVSGYFSDMYNNIKSVYNSLKPDGEYHLIVGNSMVRNVPIPTHKLLAQIAEIIGFEWTGYYWYDIKDHRTSIPRNGQGGKINVEHVISLRKSG